MYIYIKYIWTYIYKFMCVCAIGIIFLWREWDSLSLVMSTTMLWIQLMRAFNSPGNFLVLQWFHCFYSLIFSSQLFVTFLIVASLWRKHSPSKKVKNYHHHKYVLCYHKSKCELLKILNTLHNCLIYKLRLAYSVFYMKHKQYSLWSFDTIKLKNALPYWLRWGGGHISNKYHPVVLVVFWGH